MTAGSTVQGSIPKKGIKFYSVVVTDFQKTVEFDFNINADSIGINPNIVIVYQYDELPYLLRYAKKVECNSKYFKILLINVSTNYLQLIVRC